LLFAPHADDNPAGDFRPTLLGKDVFLVPYYLGKLCGLGVTIAFPETAASREVPREHRGVTLEPLHALHFPLRHVLRSPHWRLALRCVRGARATKLLMLFHFRTATYLLGLLYKALNRSGFLYVKADAMAVPQSPEPHGFGGRLRHAVYKRFLRECDLLTFESRQLMDSFLKQYRNDEELRDKTRLMPNGVDDELLAEAGVRPRPLELRENLVLTVGRLGSHQKNTAMLLDAVRAADLHGWEVVLVGSHDDATAQSVAALQADSPNSVKVTLAGPISDKKTLWELYAKAKVFVLTSRWESFGIVLSEAWLFGDYLISTDVGVAGQIVAKGYGELIPQEDSNVLADVLTRVTEDGYLASLSVPRATTSVETGWSCIVSRAVQGLAVPRGSSNSVLERR
jgi:glycosyltransferase involved in cell wall biosynthesis